MRLSTHFHRREFACRCQCGFDTVDAELLTVLQWLRYETGQPITILSGCRCKKYNDIVGGALNSQHMRGRAADITVKDMTPGEVYDLIDRYHQDRLALIRYKTFLHVDSRNFRLRM